MVKFTSLSQIKKFANTPVGQAELLKMSNIDIEKLLTNALRDLEDELNKGLMSYYDSYQPSQYKRTFDTLDSFSLGQPTQSAPGVWSASITTNNNANHESLFNGEDGNTAWLLNSGFVAEKLENSMGEVEHFTRFKGTNYIQEAVENFNRNNKYGMKVQVIFNGNDMTGMRFNYGK